MAVFEDKFFSFNIKILKLSGVWFLNYDKLWKKIIFFLYNSYALLYCIFFQITELIFILSETNNLRVLMKNIGWSMTHFIMSFKVFIWFTKRNIVINIHETLSKPEFFYPDNKFFAPTKILKRLARSNYIFISAHFWMGLLIPCAACLGNLFSIVFDPESVNGIGEFGNEIFCQKLPFTSYIPFETNTQFRCASATIIQSQGILFCGFYIISLDAIFTGTMCFLTAHINILLEAFKSIRGRCLENETENNLNKEMNKCLYYLQTIMRLCENLEAVYRFQTLVQSMDTLIVFCVNLYLVSSKLVTSMTSTVIICHPKKFISWYSVLISFINLEDKSFLSDIAYMFAVGIEFSSYCWFGNELTLASAEIPQALYESEWIHFPAKVKRSLLITMIRMKRPIVFTVGMFSPLTLDTLVSIFRASYSFFTVIRQVNE